MCLHAGIVGLRHLADFHGISYQPDAQATIAVEKHELIAACQQMAAAGDDPIVMAAQSEAGITRSRNYCSEH
jgi:hypothetical protein